jgi:hypothetical protein
VNESQSKFINRILPIIQNQLNVSLFYLGQDRKAIKKAINSQKRVRNRSENTNQCW